MSQTGYPNGLSVRVDAAERRLDRIEATEPAVLANEVKNLREDVGALKRAFYTFAVGTVTSAVAFAFTVFTLLGAP